MKRFLRPTLILFSIAAVFILQSATPRFENKSVKRIMRSWRTETGFFGFGVPAGMARIFISEDEDPELKQLLREIRMVHVLVYDKERAADTRFPKLCAQQINSAMAGNTSYKNLMSVKSSGTIVNISVKQPTANGIIEEVVILVQDDQDFVVCTVTGKIHFQSIIKLAGGHDSLCGV